MIRPRRAGRPGVVLERKAARRGEKTLARALQEGLRQLRQGDYEAELRAGGAAQVHSFVVAFDGKQVRVRAGKAGEAMGPGKAAQRPRKMPKKAVTRRK